MDRDTKIAGKVTKPAFAQSMKARNNSIGGENE